MELDVEGLLAPVSPDAPAGEDLDGTMERFAIEEAFSLDQADDDGTAEIDWRETIRLCVAQLGETKDLWLATYLMRAGAKRGDLDVVVGGAQLLAGLLDRYWDEVHPTLAMVDFIGRKAPVEALTKGRDFLNPLRRVVLMEHPRLGRYTCEDIERFAKQGSDADGYGMFQAALADLGDGVGDAVGKVGLIAESIRQADAILTANASGDTSTNFNVTYELLDGIKRTLSAFSDASGGAALDGEDADGLGDLNLDDLSLDDINLDDLDLGDLDLDGLGDGGEADPVATPAPARSRPAATARGGGGAPGRIASRGDVVAALDAIEAYYARAEPGSPVPAILRRAKGWVDMDFMALLKDLSPDSLGDARKVFGVKEDDNSGYY